MASLRILIIARHCGEIGSGGSRRPLLMAQSLVQAGHKVTVVTPFDCPSLPDVWKVPLYAGRDKPPEERAKQQIRRPEIPKTGLQSLPRKFLPRSMMAFLRRWRYFPDMEILWALAVEDHIRSTNDSFDWILTTSPPESLHFVGHRIAKKLNAKWCAELRDGWLENAHRAHMGVIRRLVERRFARYWLSKADAMVTIDRDMEREFSTYAPRTKILRLGHFSRRFDGQVFPLPGGTFNLVHAGAFSLSDHRRSLSAVLEDLSNVGSVRVKQGLPKLHFHIIGRLSDEEHQLSSAYDDKSLRITTHGAKPLETSRALQQAADALLLYSPQASRSLPGKLAEYAVSRKPIFLIGHLAPTQLSEVSVTLQPIETLASWTEQSEFTSEIDPRFDVDECMSRFAQFLRSV